MTAVRTSMGSRVDQVLAARALAPRELGPDLRRDPLHELESARVYTVAVQFCRPEGPSLGAFAADIDSVILDEGEFRLDIEQVCGGRPVRVRRHAVR